MKNAHNNTKSTQIHNPYDFCYWKSRCTLKPECMFVKYVVDGSRLAARGRATEKMRHDSEASDVCLLWFVVMNSFIFQCMNEHSWPVLHWLNVKSILTVVQVIQSVIWFIFNDSPFCCSIFNENVNQNWIMCKFRLRVCVAIQFTFKSCPNIVNSHYAIYDYTVHIVELLTAMKSGFRTAWLIRNVAKKNNNDTIFTFWLFVNSVRCAVALRRQRFNCCSKSNAPGMISMFGEHH